MILDVTNKQLIREIRHKSSYEQVLQVTIEELAELQQVSCKELRRISVDNTLRNDDESIKLYLKEEIADSLIMLLQLKEKIDLTDQELNKIINKKCLRTLGILNQKR